MTFIIKPYRRRPKIGQITPTSKMSYVGPELPERGGGVRQLNTCPPQLRRLARRIGRKRANEVWRVQQKVRATAPEALAYAWLEDWDYRFDFQSSQLGGLWVRGGAVVDFVIYDMSFEGVYLWRIQGEHWHQGARKQHADKLQKDRLRNIQVGGLPVAAVVDLWEYDIYDRPEETFERARVGEQMRYD